jgi:Fe-S-cluster-containing hydrogenase component 2
VLASVGYDYAIVSAEADMLSTQWRRVVAHADLCRDCQACALGCSLLHEGECGLGLARLVITKDMARYRFEINICRHCERPDCVDACPTGALAVDSRGVAMLDDAECTRCGACADACPYDSIYYNGVVDRYLKCDLCAGREAGPLCVELCPVGALAPDIIGAFAPNAAGEAL